MTSSNDCANLQTGLTLADYALAKGLSQDFLRSLGVRQVRRDGMDVLRIGYFDEVGTEIAVRYRIAMEGDRFRWRSGSKVVLYGLNRLAEAHQKGYVTVVEGESDAQTLWFAGEPAVAVPRRGIVSTDLG